MKQKSCLYKLLTFGCRLFGNDLEWHTLTWLSIVPLLVRIYHDWWIYQQWYENLYWCQTIKFDWFVVDTCDGGYEIGTCDYGYGSANSWPGNHCKRIPNGATKWWFFLVSSTPMDSFLDSSHFVSGAQLSYKKCTLLTFCIITWA